MRLLAVVLACVALGACGIANQINARTEYQASVDAYKACLARNQANPGACEAQRLAMDADRQRNAALNGDGTYAAPAGSPAPAYVDPPMPPQPNILPQTTRCQTVPAGMGTYQTVCR
jgi:hypothetical protein